MIWWIALLSAAQAASPAEREAKGLVESVARYGDGTAVDRSIAWWTLIDDPGLTDVLRDGLGDSPDLAIAAAQVELAQAGTWSSVGALLPTVSFEAMTQEAPTDSMTLSPFAASMPDYSATFEYLASLAPGLAAAAGEDPASVPDFGGGTSDVPDTYRSSSAMVKGAWGIDAFGRSTMTAMAAGRNAKAAHRGRHATVRSVAGQLGMAWYDLVATREQVKVIENQVQAATDLLELVELRYERGEASAIDVLQQRQQRAQIEAMLPRAKSARTAANGRLAIALGKPPSTELPASSGFPTLNAAPSIGTTDRLIHDRADVGAAIHQLDSARLRRGAAMAGLLPTLTLTGQYGKQYLTMDDTQDVDTWGVGAVATVPIFAGGRTHAGIKAAKAERDIARMRLRSTILSAVQQIESAIAAENAAADTLEAVRVQAESATAALTETRRRYSQGIAPYLAVLTATSADQAAQIAWVDAQRARLQARIQLHSALGGTWLPVFEESK